MDALERLADMVARGLKIVPGRVALREYEVKVANTPTEIAAANPSRKSIVVQHISSDSAFVAWVGGPDLKGTATGTPTGAGVRLGQYGYSPVYEHHDAVRARSDTTDPVTLRVQEEIYLDGV